ncbi:sulfatase, partial [Planctomicrobium sp.]
MAFVAQAADQPNVVFILADDLGWSDTTLFGTTKFYKTPNIERLAKRGMTFTRAYSSSPLCSPTRASVLTGLSPARHGITTPNCHLPQMTLKATANSTGPANHKATFPNSVSRLDTKYYTLAEMFKDNGYATGHFGKWHLGAEPYSPLEHGFDVDVPHHPGPGPAGSYMAPWKFKDFDHDPLIPDEHLEDRMAKEAVAFLEQHKDESFFLNYWMFSVHAPFDAKQKLIDEYRKVIDPKDPQRSPTYAAMIESMDDAVGTLLDTLDRLKIADNTIIIFASDNGGNMYNEVDGTSATSNSPLRGGKANMYEGGVRGPAIVVQPGLIPPGSQCDELIQSSDFYPTLLD